MNTIPPVSSILARGFSKHIKSGIKEQKSLYSRSGRPVKSIASFFMVTLQWGSHSVNTKGPVIDTVFSRSLAKLLSENEQVTHIQVLIKFRWKGCPHWRALPCEFGNALNDTMGPYTFHYFCNCGCS